MDAKHAVTLEQLCLLLVVTLHVLLIIDLVPISAHLDLVSLGLLLQIMHDQVVGIVNTGAQEHMMGQVLLLLEDWRVVEVWLLLQVVLLVVSIVGGLLLLTVVVVGLGHVV